MLFIKNRYFWTADLQIICKKANFLSQYIFISGLLIKNTRELEIIKKSLKSFFKISTFLQLCTLFVSWKQNLTWIRNRN
jgi:hypothetical protein